MKTLALALLMFVVGCAQANTYPLQVELPQPGYKKWDGTILKFTEFKKTTIIYGTCDPVTQIGTELGRVDVKSWSFVSPTFRVPTNMHVCVVAVVIGLDDAPMGRSNTATFWTGGPVPRSPQILRTT